MAAVSSGRSGVWSDKRSPSGCAGRRIDRGWLGRAGARRPNSGTKGTTAHGRLRALAALAGSASVRLVAGASLAAPAHGRLRALAALAVSASVPLVAGASLAAPAHGRL